MSADTEQIEEQIALLEEERDDLRRKLEQVTDERDDLLRGKDGLEVKVNDAKHALTNALRDLES